MQILPLKKRNISEISTLTNRLHNKCTISFFICMHLNIFKKIKKECERVALGALDPKKKFLTSSDLKCLLLAWTNLSISWPILFHLLLLLLNLYCFLFIGTSGGAPLVRTERVRTGKSQNKKTGKSQNGISPNRLSC